MRCLDGQPSESITQETQNASETGSGRQHGIVNSTSVPACVPSKNTVTDSADKEAGLQREANAPSNNDDVEVSVSLEEVKQATAGEVGDSLEQQDTTASNGDKGEHTASNHHNRGCLDLQERDRALFHGVTSRSRSNHVHPRDVSCAVGEFRVSLGDYDHECLDGCSNGGNGRICAGQVWSDTTVGSHNSQSVTAETAVCRICHESDQKEVLVSPCYCAGTMGLLHVSCLQTWLGLSNNTGCEICNFQFSLIRRPKPFIKFLKDPGSNQDKRNMIIDLIAFCTVTPLTVFTSWICIDGALKYYGSMFWEKTGLITLSVILHFVYIVWFVILIVHYWGLWRTWKAFHQDVTLVCKPTSTKLLDTDTNSHNIAAKLSEESVSSARSVRLDSIMINVHGPAVRQSTYGRKKSGKQGSATHSNEFNSSSVNTNLFSVRSESHFKSPRKSISDKYQFNGFVFPTGSMRCRLLHILNDSVRYQCSGTVGSQDSTPRLWPTKKSHVHQIDCGHNFEDIVDGACAVRNMSTNKTSIASSPQTSEKATTEDTNTEEIVSNERSSKMEQVTDYKCRRQQDILVGRVAQCSGLHRIQQSSATNHCSNDITQDRMLIRRHDNDEHEVDSAHGIDLQPSQATVEYTVSTYSDIGMKQHAHDSTTTSDQKVAPSDFISQESEHKELRSKVSNKYKLSPGVMGPPDRSSGYSSMYECGLQLPGKQVSRQNLLRGQEPGSEKSKYYELKPGVSHRTQPELDNSSTQLKISNPVKIGVQKQILEPNEKGTKGHGLHHACEGTKSNKHYCSYRRSYKYKDSLLQSDKCCVRKDSCGTKLKYAHQTSRSESKQRRRVSQRYQRSSNIGQNRDEGQIYDGDDHICDKVYICDEKCNCDGKCVFDQMIRPAHDGVSLCQTAAHPDSIERSVSELESHEVSTDASTCPESPDCHLMGSALAVFSRGNSPADGSDRFTSTVSSCVRDGLDGTEDGMDSSAQVVLCSGISRYQSKLQGNNDECTINIAYV